MKIAMVHFLKWFTTLCAPAFVASVSIKVDGVIDLGRNWNYEYNIESGKKSSHNEFFMSPESFMGKQISEPKAQLTNGEKKPTKYERELINDEMRLTNVETKVLNDEKKPPVFHTGKLNQPEGLPIELKYATYPQTLQIEFKDPTTKKNINTYSPRPTSKVLEPRGLYETPHTVKEDSRINEFSYHVYKQSLKVFDGMKNKVDPALKRKVDYIARSYDEKFRSFINETLDKKIKTRLGSQKVVLNIIDTSNRLLKRLVNYFIGDMNKEGVLRNNMAAANVFLKDVDIECELEMQHACTKFGICRTANGFSDFLIEFLKIIIQSEDKLVKQASDALTEVLKDTDFKKVMDAKTKRNFRRSIDLLETYDTRMVRAVFVITKNVLALKNTPINVMVTGSDHINKTVAFLEIVQELDETMPPSDIYKLEWQDLNNSLADWSDGKRKDILEIMQGLVTFIKRKGIDTLDDRGTRNVSEKLALVFS